MKVPASLQDNAWSPHPSWTRCPEPGPHKTDYIWLEDSASRPTMELLLPPFISKGRDTNRKETPTWKQDLTSSHGEHSFSHNAALRP